MESNGRLESPTEREQAILKMVVEDYIETAIPVPSVRLKKKFRVSWSPATIRKALQTLESSGHLNHIHTSSGRVPTDHGYRFYVDELMEAAEESNLLKLQILEELSTVASSVDQLIQVTANCLAQVSNLFGFVLLSSNEKARLADLQLVPLSSGSVLLVLGFQSQQIKTVILNPSVEVKDAHVNTVASVLRERLLDLTIDNIEKTIGERLKGQLVYESDIVQILIENREEYFSPFASQNLCTSQKSFLLRHPEFSKSDRLQSIVSALDNQETLFNSLSSYADRSRTLTFIGEENSVEALRNCSVVSRRFRIGDVGGRLGVIGPTRMDYHDVHGLVKTFSSVMRQLFHG
ncbi:MAG: heat-inducible transcriptional repressor HrcA [Candidatus Neomarinimicrobiota bacterium]